VPRLFALAQHVQTCTEFGVRGGVSTIATLYAQPLTMRCYDLNPCRIIDELQAVRGRTDLQFFQADTRTMPVIERTELLFIDTTHTYECLKTELSRHAHMVSRFLAFHDTFSNAVVGDDGGPGLWKAIGELLAQGQWAVVEHTRDNCGFTVLERLR
jgi:hypothetical protein